MCPTTPFQSLIGIIGNCEEGEVVSVPHKEAFQSLIGIIGNCENRTTTLWRFLTTFQSLIGIIGNCEGIKSILISPPGGFNP